MSYFNLLISCILISVGLTLRVFRSRKAKTEGRLKVAMWGPVVHPMKTWDWGTAITLIGLMILRSELNEADILRWAEGWQYLAMGAVFVLLLYVFHWLGLLFANVTNRNADPQQETIREKQHL